MSRRVSASDRSSTEAAARARWATSASSRALVRGQSRHSRAERRQLGLVPRALGFKGQLDLLGQRQRRVAVGRRSVELPPGAPLDGREPLSEACLGGCRGISAGRVRGSAGGIGLLAKALDLLPEAGRGVLRLRRRHERARRELRLGEGAVEPHRKRPGHAEQCHGLPRGAPEGVHRVVAGPPDVVQEVGDVARQKPAEFERANELELARLRSGVDPEVGRGVLEEGLGKLPDLDEGRVRVGERVQLCQRAQAR
jgi:hypothetical protein